MQTVFIGLLCFFCFTHILTAQQTNVPKEELVTETHGNFWIFDGTTGLKLTQSSLSNWIPGGESFFAIGGLLDILTGYDDTIRHRWMTQLHLEYGITRQGGDKDIFIKNNDVLRFSSVYGRALTHRLSLSAAAIFNSQLAQGFRYVETRTDSSYSIKPVFLSAFMSPAFFEPSVGITYMPTGQTAKDKNAWAVMVFPVSGKFTFVLDDRSTQWRNAMEPGQRVRSEVGSRLSTTYNKEVMPNMTIKSNLMAFANFQKFTHVDINFNMLISMRVNKYIGSDLSVDLMYDDDVSGRIQFRNLLNVGLSVKL